MSDLIDRAEAQTEIMMSKNVYMLKGEPSISVSDAVQVLRQIPSVTPHPCEDAISRQAVFDTLKEMMQPCGDGLSLYDQDNFIHNETLADVHQTVEELPSVSTEKTGRAAAVLLEKIWLQLCWERYYSELPFQLLQQTRPFDFGS